MKISLKLSPSASCQSSMLSVTSRRILPKCFIKYFLDISAFSRWFGQHQCGRCQQSDVGLPDDSDPGWTGDPRVLRSDVRMDEPHHNHVTCFTLLYFQIVDSSNSMNAGKSSQLEKRSFGSQPCTTLLEHVLIVRTSCFDTDFASQMKLTKLPLTLC